MSQKAILCVDDEELILNSLSDQLHNHFGDRYIYEFAESADEALEVIEELDQERVKILVIVSDWLMPGMKGDEFLIWVHQRYPQIITVMLTGQADQEAIERVRKHANLHRCLYKPWSEEDLIETLQSGLA
jgi:CheY-like chemotaxis protein